MSTPPARASSGPHDTPLPVLHPPLILAFGDSLTAGYGLPSFQSFAAQLEAQLQAACPGARVINGGMSGDTTGMALKRLAPLLSRLKAKPDLAIVELGANDLLRGITPASTRANLDMIVIELSRMGIDVLLARMELPPMLGAFADSCNTIYTDIAARHGIPSAPFFPKDVLANPALCLRDGIHPNALGTAAIARAFAPAVIAALQGEDTAGQRVG